MSFDCSRFSFNAWRDFLGVIMQQGRVQLDSDWNEFVNQLLRRIQAGSLDTYTQAVVPRVTPDGFRIEAAGGGLTIGRGRMYVDGLLVENHGGGARRWETTLAEETGTTPLNYTNQPFYPEPPALPASGPHLVYLDVWQRDVTYLQVPELIEKAVGIDTTARLQTVWQVKVLPNIGAAVCATPDAAVPGWEDTIRPSGARLTTSTGTVPGDTDPCHVPPSGGYKGLENQLYRIEIHAGGANPAFKWSRDNATVASAVVNINNARDRIVVESVGRDDVLGFSDGDWVEVTDDVRELHGEAGFLRRIVTGGGVDDATRTIRLTSPLPAGEFPTDAQGRPTGNRHTRVRRWDQKGQVRRADGTVFVDLDLAGSTGLIPIPPAGVSVFLEQGILASFSTVPGAGGYKAGDHWCFAARASDATIDILTQAPPRGIHHHYARLAVVTFPDNETDCRVLWPPEAVAGHDCSCDRCVTVEGHNNGTATLQQAVNALPNGGVICLEAGIYRLRDTLRITGAGGLRIRGKGWRTLLLMEAPGPAIEITGGLSVTLESFAAAGSASRDGSQGLISARNTTGLTAEELFLLVLSPQDAQSVAIGLSGYMLGLQIRQCVLVADIGIRGGPDSKQFLLGRQLLARENLFLCARRGVSFERFTILSGETRFSDNLFLFSSETGLRTLGATVPGSTFLIESNVLQVAGEAVHSAVDGLRVLNNEILGEADQETSRDGIVLDSGLDPSGNGHCWIIGNRIARLNGDAVSIRAPFNSVMIKQNVFDQTAGAVVFSAAGSVAFLSIENNHLLRIAAGQRPQDLLVAIQILAARRVAITGNVISGFANDATRAAERVAVRVVNCEDLEITGNHFSEIGPNREYIGSVIAIELMLPLRLVNICANTIQRSMEANAGQHAAWTAIALESFSRLRRYSKAVVFPARREEGFLLTDRSIKSLRLLPAASASVRANRVLAQQITDTVVRLSSLESTQFCDNFCSLQAGEANRRAPAVRLESESAIVAQNRVTWNNSDQPSVLILSRNFTALGNITMGRIELPNSTPLPTPWDALNVIG